MDKNVIISKYTTRLKDIQHKYGDDIELRHLKEDLTLCELLTELGYNTIVDIYNKTHKWYA